MPHLGVLESLSTAPERLEHGLQMIDPASRHEQNDVLTSWHL